MQKIKSLFRKLRTINRESQIIGSDDQRYLNSSKNWWKYDPKWIAYREILKNEDVLDVGCSYGDFGKKLKEKGCKVDGVEIDLIAAAAAREYLDHVDSFDIDQFPVVSSMFKKVYDTITYMDVLEHCKNPDLVISEFNKYLARDGRIIVSVPNIVNIKERFLILCGRFNYEEYGVMDRTHLRFYTRASSYLMISRHFENVRFIGYTPRFNSLNRLVNIWPTLFALQFVIEGKFKKDD
jgi:2-polyprenyl-3-methyl-5-hydroxy-6-metoxy-1,4-benzoquinol methylase